MVRPGTPQPADRQLLPYAFCDRPLLVPTLLTALMLSLGWRSMFILLCVVGVMGAVKWFVGVLRRARL